LAITRNIVKKNFYRDSVQLLHITERLKEVSGVVDAAVLMGTSLNKEILRKEGLLTEEGAKASEEDMIIAIKAVDEDALERAVERAESLLSGEAEEADYYSIDSAVKALGGVDLAVISVPGQYVRDLALDLLERGVNLFIFSDHVPLAHEVEIKSRALEKRLLVMGPAAGTSIISGVAIGFANKVRRGPIGLVAAAGTGLQEVSTLVSNAGAGITHGIGVGGGDVKREVGGAMTVFSLELLGRDRDTEIIGVVSKPPDPEVETRILEASAKLGKPVVLCFIGGRLSAQGGAGGKPGGGRVYIARSLHSAAIGLLEAFEELGLGKASRPLVSYSELARIAEKEISRLEPGQDSLRGLFTGGTLTFEALVMLEGKLKPLYSNTPIGSVEKLPDPFRSEGNSVVDMGEEEFTRGRPHPIIDPTLRNKRLLQEARDTRVAVIMMDFVLGYGAHRDPVGSHLEAIRAARELAEENGRHLTLLAHVIGTPEDPQNLEEQVNKLAAEGVIVLPTNALMTLLSYMIVARETGEEKVRPAFQDYVRGIWD
jgi:succinyl-CoA synthetase alpha subunit